jgi:hypothetical protein
VRVQLDTSGNSEARLFIANGCRSRSTSRTPPLSTSVGRVAFQLQQSDSPRNLQQLEQQRHRRSGSDCSVSSGARGVYTTALTTGASSSSISSSSAAHKRSQQQHNDANTVVGDILATGAANHAYSTTVTAVRTADNSSSANTGTGSSSAAVNNSKNTSSSSAPMTVTGPKRVWAGPFARLTAAANSSIISAITGITGGRLASSHNSSDSGVITSKCIPTTVTATTVLMRCNDVTALQQHTASCS